MNRIATCVTLLLLGSFSLLAQNKKQLPSGLYEVVKKSTYVYNDPDSEQKIYLLPANAITAKHMEAVRVSVTSNGAPQLDLKLNAAGAALFAKQSARLTGKTMAILLSGKVVSVPKIIMPITNGRVSVSGNFTYAVLDDLRKKLEKEIQASK